MGENLPQFSEWLKKIELPPPSRFFCHVFFRPMSLDPVENSSTKDQKWKQEIHLMYLKSVHKFVVKLGTLQGTNISPQNGILKMIFLFPRWDMLIPWRVILKSLYEGAC